MNSSVSVRSGASGPSEFEASHREQSLAIEGSEAALSRQVSVESLPQVKQCFKRYRVHVLSIIDITSY
jgi:hypothetical protein